jgi:DNA-binding MarR family transcriptional regulator
MEMQQIRYFLALCEAGNFSRAAARCGISQPSLSNAIKQLEAELGGPLFERNHKTSRSRSWLFITPKRRHRNSNRAKSRMYAL